MEEVNVIGCFPSVKLTKFELALQEELPELNDAIRKLISETSNKKWLSNVFFASIILKTLEDIYDKQGREGLRTFRENKLLVNPAHENAHES